MAVEVYPSIKEILPDLMLSMVPVTLANSLTDRYRVLGKKYLTDEYHTDGRRINDCMNKNSSQDCIEEVIDAVFNMLVQIYKDRLWEPVIDDTWYTILRGLIEIYTLLYAKIQQEANDALG